MNVLRNLEAKLGGLVEGAFSRAFKSSVQPAELARKLAKEMEDNKAVSVSQVYVPNHYRIFLSTRDREQFSGYEGALRKELSDYLLDHARQEGLALTSRPGIEFMTDDRLGLGEFGIQAQTVAQEGGEPEAPAAASSAEFGHTMVYSPDRSVRRLEPDASSDSGRALLVSEGKRTVVSGDGAVIGRSRDCDAVLDDPNVSRRHAELRRDGSEWLIRDLGSTNGVKVNGRRVDEARLSAGDEIRIGVTELSFELED